MTEIPDLKSLYSILSILEPRYELNTVCTDIWEAYVWYEQYKVKILSRDNSPEDENFFY